MCISRRGETIQKFPFGQASAPYSLKETPLKVKCQWHRLVLDRMTIFLHGDSLMGRSMSEDRWDQLLVQKSLRILKPKKFATPWLAESWSHDFKPELCNHTEFSLYWKPRTIQRHSADRDHTGYLRAQFEEHSVLEVWYKETHPFSHRLASKPHMSSWVFKWDPSRCAQVSTTIIWYDMTHSYSAHQKYYQGFLKIP